MGIGTAIAAAATVGGALLGNSASRRASETVADATDQQIALQRDVYNDTVQRQQPFYNTGVAANAAAAELMGLNVRQQQQQPTQPAQPQYGGYGQGVAGLVGNSFFKSQNPDGTPIARDFRDLQGRNGITGPSGNNGGGPSIISDGQGGYRPTTGGSIGALQTGQPTQPAQPQTTSNGQPIYQNQQLTAIQQSPGYQFRLQEGMNQLETGAAARGGLLSGGHIRQGTRYAQDYASNEYNNRFNQLQALQSGGQAAASNAQSAGSQYAANAGNAIGQNANYQANQQQQRASMFGGALGNIGGLIGGAL